MTQIAKRYTGTRNRCIRQQRSGSHTVPPSNRTVDIYPEALTTDATLRRQHRPVDNIRAPAYHAHTRTRVHCSCSQTTASAMLYAALTMVVRPTPFKNATQRHTHYANSQTSQTSQPLRYITHATAATPQPLCYRCHPRRHPCNMHTRSRSSRASCAYADVLNVMPQVTVARGVV